MTDDAALERVLGMPALDFAEAAARLDAGPPGFVRAYGLSSSGALAVDGIAPGYEQLDVSAELGSGTLVPVASGKGHDAAISIHQRDAVLWAARLQPGERVEVPNAEYGHLFVAKGTGEFEANGLLDTGDAVRLTRADELSLVAGDDGAEVLIWTTGAL